MEHSYHPLSLLISDYIPSISDFFPFCFTEVRGQLRSPMMDSQKKCHRLLYLFLVLTSEAPFNCKTLCFTYYPSLVFTRDASKSMWWEVTDYRQVLVAPHSPESLEAELSILSSFVVSEATIFEGSVTS